MRYLGLDLGSKTLGLAISDKTGLIATSYKTIFYDNENKLLTELKQIIEENEITSLVLGLPKNMNNSIGFRGKETLEFKEKLEKKFGLEVNLIDERLTSKEATNYMLEANVSRKKRKKKIDSLAALIILQTYLDRKEVKK